MVEKIEPSPATDCWCGSEASLARAVREAGGTGDVHGIIVALGGQEVVVPRGSSFQKIDGSVGDLYELARAKCPTGLSLRVF